MASIALGSILGGAMVAIALAFGISDVVALMTFAQVPPQILAVQMLAVVFLAALALDGQLSRVDGGILLLGFGLAVLYLVRLGRRGLDFISLRGGGTSPAEGQHPRQMAISWPLHPVTRRHRGGQRDAGQRFVDLFTSVKKMVTLLVNSPPCGERACKPRSKARDTESMVLVTCIPMALEIVPREHLLDVCAVCSRRT
jgi:hypothetical protein